jgi:ribosomal protein L12E/L44/L45/RPP1/RPP2
MRGRRVARRTGRRTARRTSRRTVRRMRRRRRRRLLVGGFVLLAVGGAAYGAIKLTQKDSERIEEHTGASVEELTEEELVQAMKDLGIQSIELDEADKEALAVDSAQAAPATSASAPQPATSPASSESYLDELEKLADLRDRGVISPEDFEAKKKQLLGI